MNIKDLRSLNYMLDKLEEAELALTHCNTDYRRILEHVGRMKEVDLIRMFNNHYMSEVDHYRNNLRDRGVKC